MKMPKVRCQGCGKLTTRFVAICWRCKGRQTRAAAERVPRRSARNIWLSDRRITQTEARFLLALQAGPLTLPQLRATTGVSQCWPSAVTNVLRGAGLVTKTRRPGVLVTLTPLGHDVAEQLATVLG
jgi:DNA-binding MarR family transcriptional regulator